MTHTHIRTALVLAVVTLSVRSALAQPAVEVAADPEASVITDDDAIARARRTMRFDVFWQNDGTILKPNHGSDRHYTNGAALNFAYQPDWAQALAAHMPFAGQFGEASTAAGFTIGQLMFTPNNLDTRRALPDDWPYSGYLYAGLYWQRSKDLSDSWRTLDHFQLDVGLVGEASLAEEAQKFIHDWRNLQNPNGWDNQQGDAASVQFTLRKKWLLNVPLGGGDLEGSGGWSLQVIPQVGAAVGTVFRHLEGDAILRLGWNLPDGFGPGRLADLPDATAGLTPGWSFYGFGRVGGKIVEHNQMFEGRGFEVDEETFTSDWQAGLALLYGWETFTAELVYSQTFLSEQFQGQELRDSFGGLGLMARWLY